MDALDIVNGKLSSEKLMPLGINRDITPMSIQSKKSPKVGGGGGSSN
jgi:hypothetical protein